MRQTLPRRCLAAMAAAAVLAVACAGCGNAGSATASPHGTAGAANASGAPQAGKNAGAAYFKGKTVTWIVPYKAGGGFDTVSRLVAPYFGRLIGAKVVVENKPGAGGLVALNDLAVSRPDGLTVELVNGPGTAATEIAKNNGVKKAQGLRVDLRQLSWIGRITDQEPTVYVAPDSPLKSIRDLLKTRTEIVWGAPGIGSAPYIDGLILADALGTRFKIVNGFPGNKQVMAAVIGHELNLASMDAGTASSNVKAGSIRALMVLARKPYVFLPDVPTLMRLKGLIPPKGFSLLEEFVRFLNGTGRALATSPGVPRDRVGFLSAALEKALNDPKLVGQARQHGFLLDPLQGPQELALFKRAVAPSSELRRLVVSAYSG